MDDAAGAADDAVHLELPLEAQLHGSGAADDEHATVVDAIGSTAAAAAGADEATALEEDVTSWYAATFESELRELQRSSRRASRGTVGTLRSPDDEDSLVGMGLGAGAAGEGGRDGEGGEDGDGEDARSSASSSQTATKLEIALMQAQEQAESRAAEKDLLEARLVCLGEIEELRMQLATLELQLLLEAQAQQLAVGARGPPRWSRDEDHARCQRCQLDFSLLRRRHHCRKCGHCLCDKCAPPTNNAPLPLFGYRTPVRQCVDCLPLPGGPGETGARASSPATQDASLLGLGSGSDESDSQKSEAPSTSASYASSSASSSAIDAGTASSKDKKPFSSAIDAIRRMESNCLKHPSSENMVLALQAYVVAIERIAKSEVLRDVQFRRRAHATLLKAMHAFLQMPVAQECLGGEDDNRHAHAVIRSAMSPVKSPVKSKHP